MVDDSTVLVVDDERDVADTYADALNDEYSVTVAYSGEGALDAFDEGVDVMLLDRRMPDLSGDEVLEAVQDRATDCRVVMVTAVDPTLDIVEMPFDEYLTKPIKRDELLAAIDRLLGVSTSPGSVRDYLALAAKHETLEEQLTSAELDTSDEYARLTTAMDAFESRVVSLAETVLESDTADLPPGDRRELRRERDRLERERDGLPENDPLRKILGQEISELESLLGTDSGSGAPKREFLDAVSEGFVARGFWLDSTILRALNVIFFEKESDRLVLEHHPLTPSSKLEGKELVTVSTAVRDRAAAAKRR
jgi:DNA-binding response OmpR family regulator